MNWETLYRHGISEGELSAAQLQVLSAALITAFHCRLKVRGVRLSIVDGDGCSMNLKPAATVENVVNAAQTISRTSGERLAL